MNSTALPRRVATVAWATRRPLALGAAALAVLTLALALRLTGLTAQSLWFDEGASLVRSGGASLGDWAAGLQATHASERYQPLYFAVLRAWRGAFGDGEAALRSLSVVCGVGAVAAVAAAGALLGGALHGLLAAALLAVSAFAVTYSQEVRPYALLMLLAALQIAAVLADLRRPQTATATRRLAWLATGVGAWAGPFAILASLALAAAHLAVLREGRRWLGWWLPPLALALPLIIYLAWSLLDPAPARAELVNPRQQPLWQNALFVAYGLLAGSSFAPPPEALRDGAAAALRAWWPALLLLAAATAVLAVCSARATRRLARDDRRRGGVHLLLLTLAGGAGLQLAFAAVTGFNWQPRHACALLLPLVLLAPLAVSASGGAARSAATAEAGLAWLAVLVLASCNGLALLHYFTDPAYQRDDYRAAAAYVRAHAAPDGAVRVLWGRAELLAYYGAPGAIDGTEFGKGYLGARVAAALGDAPTVLLVVNRPHYWDDDPSALVTRALGDRFRLTAAGTTPAFAYFHLERR